MKRFRLLSLLLPLFLGGCEALHSGGGRVIFLVVVPTILIGIIGYFVFRKKDEIGRDTKRDPAWPDYDERE